MLLKYFFYFCVFILSIGQLAGLSRGGTYNVYLFDLVLCAFVLFGLFYFVAIKRTFKIPKTLYLFLVFCFVAVVSLVPSIGILTSSQLLISGFYLIRWSIYVLSSVVVYNMLWEEYITIDEIVYVVMLSALFVSITGFFQLIVLPDFTLLDSDLGWDPHKNRLASTFFDPNFVGGYLTACICIIFWFFITYKDKLNTIRRVLICFSGLVILIALFLTFSRSSWLMFSSVILFYGVFRYRWLLIVGFLVAFLAYFSVPRVQTRIAGITDPADSAHFRIISWKNTLEIAQDNIFLGVGFNTFRYAQEDYGFFESGDLGGRSGAGSDSSFLLVLATTGIVGFVIFITGYMYPVFRCLAYKKYNCYMLIISLFGGLFVHSQFINSLFYPQILFLWLMCLSMVNHLFSHM